MAKDLGGSMTPLPKYAARAAKTLKKLDGAVPPRRVVVRLSAEQRDKMAELLARERAREAAAARGRTETRAALAGRADALIASADWRDRQRGWGLRFEAETGQSASDLVDGTLARLRGQKPRR